MAEAHRPFFFLGGQPYEYVETDWAENPQALRDAIVETEKAIWYHHFALYGLSKVLGPDGRPLERDEIAWRILNLKEALTRLTSEGVEHGLIPDRGVSFPTFIIQSFAILLIGSVIY